MSNSNFKITESSNHQIFKSILAAPARTSVPIYKESAKPGRAAGTRQPNAQIHFGLPAGKGRAQTNAGIPSAEFATWHLYVHERNRKRIHAENFFTIYS
jgi:hypothetical protein